MADDGGFKINSAFLGVVQSLSGRTWRERPAEAATIRALIQGLDLEEPLARALASRGVGADQAVDFLSPTLRALFPDPSSFMDMDAAAEPCRRLASAGADSCLRRL
jgi:single-stranded-DNA-specific exonuclease